MKANTAIVILNYKNYQDTINCINSILKSNNKGYVIIVVDNDSRNDSLAHLNRYFSGTVPTEFYTEGMNPDTTILLVENKVNSGYAAGNNVGLRIGYKLGFEYLMVLNNDTLFSDNCLEGLMSAFGKNVICSGPLLVKGDNTIDFNCSKRRPVYSDFFTLSYFGKSRQTESWKKEYYYLKKYPGLKETITVDIISGSCMLFNAELFNEVDFFDETTFLYYEEAIISEKARQKNYIFKFVPTVTVVHLGAQSTKKFTHSAFLLNCEYESAIHYLTKWRKVSLFKAKLICSAMKAFIVAYSLKSRVAKSTSKS